MNIRDLEGLGLSEAEAKLYLALLRLGPSDAKALVRETNMFKANVYQSLERLYRKGIISQHTEEGRKLFRIQRPDSLLEYIAQKEENIQKQRKLAKKLIKEVEHLKKIEQAPESASVFYGLAGVKKVFRDVIERELDCMTFGSTLASETIIGSYFWDNFHQKQLEKGLKMKLLFHQSLRHWKGKIPEEVADIRFLDEELEPLTETTIYGDTVALSVWLETPITTIIQNQHVANSYKQVFDIMWRHAKE